MISTGAWWRPAGRAESDGYRMGRYRKGYRPIRLAEQGVELLLNAAGVAQGDCSPGEEPEQVGRLALSESG
jgi:hypothetical protein